MICAISQRSSVSPIRSTIAPFARAMLRWRHEQQPVAVDAWLHGEGKPQKQHDKEVSDGAHGAQYQFQALAEDGAAARGDGAGARKVMRCGAGVAGAGAVRKVRGRCGQISEIEKTGIDAVLLQECLDVDELRLDRVGQHRRLLRDGGAAEENHPRQHAREHQADHGQPQRMRQPDDTPEQIAHGIERHAEQHAGKNQEQGRGEMSRRTAKTLRTARRRCRRPISPTPDRCGPEARSSAGAFMLIPSRCVVDAPLFRQNATGIKR